MALRYSYDVKQGGWVLDNKGHFQTPLHIAQYYGQDAQGFKMNDGGIADLNDRKGALVLGYARDDKNQCYIDPNAPRNPYESEGCPGKKPSKSNIPDRISPKPPVPKHTKRDMVALLVAFLLAVIAVFAFQAMYE